LARDVITDFRPDELLWRVINPAAHLKPNGELSTAAFSNTSGTSAMSVDCAQLSTPQESAARMAYNPRIVAPLTVGLCTEQGQTVEHTPTSSPPNPAHCDVVGRKPPGVQRALRDFAAGRLIHVDP
jgi:hypothetical protein